MRNHKTKKLADGAPESERLAEIYHVAAQIICDKGFDAMTMNDIADAVGMTKAGVYHYIQGKRELLFGIMDYGMTQLEQRVIAPASGIADPEERLHAIIAAHAQMIANGQHAITIVVDEVAGLETRSRKAINERKHVYFEFLRATLEELKAQGRLQDIDTTVAAFSLFGMILWLPHWFRTEGRLNTEQVVNELIKMASIGLVRPATKAVRKTARD
jgi:TetR/AcrR family transcriptional regulator, cholesterol catabolism regulator